MILHHPDGARIRPPTNPQRRRGAANCCGCPNNTGVPIFEDDLLTPNLIWDGKRPAPRLLRHEPEPQCDPLRLPSRRSIAPGAARRAFLVAPWAIMSRHAGNQKPMRAFGARSSRWCSPNIARRISPRMWPELRQGPCAQKVETLDGDAGRAVRQPRAEFEDPKGGIFPVGEAARTMSTPRSSIRAALKEGVAINPGSGVVDRRDACGRTLAAILLCEPPTSSRSARASRSLRRCAGASSACRRAAPMWRRRRGVNCCAAPKWRGHQRGAALAPTKEKARV